MQGRSGTRLCIQDGFGTMHSGWIATLQLTTNLLPAPQLDEMFPLNLALCHRQLYYLWDNKEQMSTRKSDLSLLPPILGSPTHQQPLCLLKAEPRKDVNVV